MFQKSVRRAALTVAVMALGFGLAAPAAVAADNDPGAVSPQAKGLADDALPMPDGVSKMEWATALDEAQAEFGTGDKAYLEATKTVNALAVVYCDAVGSWGPSGVTYTIRYPMAYGYGAACVMESGLGPNNGAVMVLQNALNKCYGRSLVVDGSFGPKTYTALMYAQAYHGIAVDGVWGPVTRKTVKLPDTNGLHCTAYPG